MKILWLSHFLPYPPKGGALQRSHNLLRQAARRHEVHLVSLNQRAILPTREAVEEASTFLNNLCRRVDCFPIPSDSGTWRWAAMAMASYFRSDPYDANWLANREMGRFLRDLAQKETFDLIHVDTLGLYQYAAAFHGIPVVLNHHNVESHMMVRRCDNERNAIKRIYFRRESSKLLRYEQVVCGKCVLNLVVSGLDGSRLKDSAGNVRVRVIPNGVDVDYFRPGDPQGKTGKGLVFAGAMDWYPNREAVRFFLKEIWPILLEDDRDRTVTFLGKNPPRELLEASKHRTVVAPGFVPDVRPYLDSAQVYICPIRDGGGTRLKILDALSMGKPVVATGMAVEGLDLTEDVHYLRADTAVEFVTQIKRLECEPGLCRDISRAGRMLVRERYSWDVIGEDLDKAYGEAVRHAEGTRRPNGIPVM